ncbi:acylphosphatase [Chitinophaga terrae (ex Kim and Jung 2007)]|uniref:acylphosphatase n=1 Tax=Chitinophaga terrae (ex Kim and Jung 2007) TaxID=408074 RepID=A0A1H3WX91_9BACT|nr:acylphosphatase [Chitinophaga terrae (ex Kim and Jung 2007)]GEP90267.1 acylphosphatase [Chitinophaga terrae (ex Kim and Jung 2007)]SDZ91590.1 acylphosphatase [Chitinophaga terrae (ex Kim and Jung 2007)]
MTTQSIIHKEIIIKGHVQGVGFRVNAKRVAESMKVQGQVKNLLDGSVWIMAEATPENMENFISWCKSGPAMAVVKEVNVTDGEVEHIKGFTILYS